VRRKAIAVGEVLIDEFPDRRIVAGAPLHVLAHLVALGWDAAMVTRVGDDADGRTIVATMQAAGIDSGMVEVDDALPTGTTAITLLPNGGHTFNVTRPAAWDAIVGPKPIPDHDVLVFGTLALRDQRSRVAVERLSSRATMTVLDLNLRPPHYDAATVGAAVALAHLIKATEEEEAIVTGLLGIESLFAHRADWVCVTRGSQGAALRSRSGRSWSVPAVATEVVDAVGAGDAFLAGLVDALATHRDPQAAMERAAHLASETLRHRGGMPATSGQTGAAPNG
jgi:fructokinase